MAAKYFTLWTKADPNDRMARDGLEKAIAKGGMAPESEADLKPERPPLLLKEAPWSNGEVSRYRLKTPTGLHVGPLVWEVHEVDEKGIKAWEIEQRMYAAINDRPRYTAVRVEQDSFSPIESRIRDPLGLFHATYGKGTVNLLTKVQGQENKLDIPVSEKIYDNDQVLYLLRRLPLEKGYQAVFDILPIQGGTPLTCRIKVTGQKQITVPAGLFDCYELDLAVLAGGAMALQHTPLDFSRCSTNRG